MKKIDYNRGRLELTEVRKSARRYFWIVGTFSVFTNLLMLTGPLYMLQIYDRVLSSRSIETLVALSILVTFMYLMMGLLDFARGRVMSRVGADFQKKLDKRVFEAAIREASVNTNSTAPPTGLRDLESVQRLFSSPAFIAFFDIPWTPIFLAGIALFHPWLGILAVSGGAVLIFITVLNQIFTKRALLQANSSSYQANALSDQLSSEAEMVSSLGMSSAAYKKWHSERGKALSLSVSSNDQLGVFSALTKTLRLFLQSAMLGLGAYLVLQNEMTAGAMIAGSILMGRALAPLEQVIGQWSVVQSALKGWGALVELLSTQLPKEEKTQLPKPQAVLEVQNVVVLAPGQQSACLKNINFKLEPGQACGVIGPSGAGKSSLAKLITGVWRPVSGKVRLNGASLDQYAPDDLGQYIGYLPQRVQLFHGTIAENIARLEQSPDSEKIIAAARKAAAHEMILQLPEGYDTVVSPSGGQLSGGQLQRVGLARALYSDPVLLVLDEPNSNLDNVGNSALNQAIKQMKEQGKCVLVMAHRPAAIQECDHVLMLEQSAQVAFGPKEKVLESLVKNHQAIKAAKNTGVA